MKRRKQNGLITHDGAPGDVVEAIRRAAEDVHGVPFDVRLDKRLAAKIRRWLRRQS